MQVARHHFEIHERSNAGTEPALWRLMGSHQYVRRHIVASIIWAVLVVILVLWLLGFIVGVGGSLIHLLLVVALLLIIYNLITGRRAL